MESNTKDERKVVLPYYDLVFKKTFTSPENLHIAEGFLTDLADNDPLGLMSVNNLEAETPYNFADVNQLIVDSDHSILITEVDFSCNDIKGSRYVVEMQVQGQTYLEERITYNTSQKYAQTYANVPKKEIKYQELKPVISVTILYENYYDDPHAIRYLRPHDERIHAYKKNPNLGLEIVIELNKDTSNLPINLQHWIHYFKTGKALADAPSYIQEAAKLTEITSYTKEEREWLDRVDRAQQTRLVEDDYIRVKTTEEVTERVTKQVTEQVTKQVTEEVTKEVTKQRNIEIAKNLINTGIVLDSIIKVTGLSEQEVLDLK